MISAEIPDEEEDPCLHGVVNKNMIDAPRERVLGVWLTENVRKDIQGRE